MSSLNNILAIDIGGTSIKYGVVSKDLEILKSFETPTEAHLGGPHIQKKVLNIVSELKSEVSLVGISTAGMVNPNTGEIIFSGPQIPEYIGINLKNAVEKEFGIKTEVDNDVKSAGLAEFSHGAGKIAKSAVVLTVGTGIGGSYYYRENGEIITLRGSQFAAMEVGYLHISQDNENFQSLSSTRSLVKEAEKLTGEQGLNGRIIFERIKKGDEKMLHALHQNLHNLAKGIANICFVLNPEMVILGGGIMEQREIIRPILIEKLRESLVPIFFENLKLEFATFNNQAGMVGAAINVLSKNRK